MARIETNLNPVGLRALPEPYWRFMCDSCNAKIAAETYDVMVSSDGVYFVSCPVCSFNTEVPPMLLADAVKRYAPRSKEVFA